MFVPAGPAMSMARCWGSNGVLMKPCAGQMKTPVALTPGSAVADGGGT